MDDSLEKKIIKIEANPLLSMGKPKSQFKRVAAYCRVSTEEEEQLGSLNSQVAYYTQAIAKNPNWKFAGIYADKGISGTGTKNRKEFLRLMQDCEKGKIDLILTKSISRFARNTVDSLTWIRKLKAMGVGVYFEEQGINSLSAESEMLIGFFSVIAQSESENIGANVRWGIRKRMKTGEFGTNFSCYGYRRGENGVPSIVPEEAAVVRTIFELYIDGKSLNQIVEYLSQNHIKTAKGCQRWSKTFIGQVLTNEKYIGDLLLQKSYRVDSISKKVKKNNGELPKYLVKNNHPAIIDRETFGLAQAEMEKRNNQKKKSKFGITEFGKYSGKYALSNLLFCGCCGSNYRRTGSSYKGKKIYYWRCIGKIEGRCKNSVGIEETKLQSAICRCLSKIFERNEQVEPLCPSDFKYAISGEGHGFDAARLEEQIKKHYEEIDVLMVLSEKTEGDVNRCEKEIIKLYKEIPVLRERLELAKNQVDAQESIQAEIDRTCSSIRNYSSDSFKEFDDDTVRRLVERIEVSPDRKIKMTLKGGATGEELIS